MKTADVHAFTKRFSYTFSFDEVRSASNGDDREYFTSLRVITRLEVITYETFDITNVAETSGKKKEVKISSLYSH